MKKRIQLALMLALSTGFFVNTAVALDELDVSEVHKPAQITAEKARQTLEQLKEDEKGINEALTKISEEQARAQDAANTNKKQIDFFTRADRFLAKVDPLQNAANELLNNMLKGHEGTNYGDVITHLQSIDGEAFKSEIPIVVGQNIFVPGFRASQTPRGKNVEIKSPGNAQGSWQLNLGSNQFVEGDYDLDTQTVTFDGTRKNPDGSVLILKQEKPENFDPRKHQLLFMELSKAESTQFVVNSNTFEHTLREEFSKGQVASVSVPRSLMASLGVLAQEGPNESIYAMAEHSAKELERRIGVAEDTIAQWAEDIMAPKEEESPVLEEDHDDA